MIAHESDRIERDLAATAARDGTRVAVDDGGSLHSWAELAARADAFAAALLARGLRPRDRVAVFLDKSADAVVALYGAWRAGAIAVPVYEGLKQRQLEYVLEHSEARFVATSARRRPLLGAAIARGVEAIEPALAPARAATALPGELPGGAEPAVILYTSGSTGRPKGIVVSHANLVAGARIVCRYLGLRADDRLLSVLPLSFDYGLNQLLCCARLGATLVLQRSTFPADVCRTLAERRVTVMAAVPPLWIQLMGPQSPLAEMELPALRLMTNSGGRLPAQVVQRYRDRFPHVEVVLMYGLSEAFRSTYLPASEVDRRPESIGRAIPETEILVHDAAGRACAPDEVGELVHRGPTVALGYWRDAEATAARFRPDPRGGAGRVVHSGDLVRRDAEGFLFFVGRGDQMIKTQGFRVSAEEVEGHLLASELVAEVAVTTEPDPVAGAALVAHVVATERADERALRAWCRRELPGYMVPKRFELHAALPRTASGKLDRQALAS